MTHETIDAYNAAQGDEEQRICSELKRVIERNLPEADSTIWHAHPVWFLDSNPIVGYSKLKDCIRLMFWSGADFGEDELTPGTGKFKDASIRYTNADQVKEKDLQRWLEKSRTLQWDYKNLVKRKGRLERLNPT